MPEPSQIQPIPGGVTGTPRLLLGLEGLAVFVAALVAYWALGANWWVFVLLFLAPDLSFFGYLAGERTGAVLYNAVHTYVVPILLALVGHFIGNDLVLSLAVIWLAHIGADRALGYGLKYPGGFSQTHLGPIGKARKG